MTHANNCLLASRCKVANGPTCNRTCSAYISLHGYSETGGRVANAGTPADYRLLTLKTSPAAEEQAKIYATLENYVATFERQFEEGADRIKDLYLWSTNTGTGKSTTASALLNEYLIAHYLGSLKRGRQTLQLPAYFLSVNNLQQTHNKTHLPASLSTKEKLGEELIREIEKAKKVPFLVMDDLAVRKATPAFVGMLYDICDYRASNSLPTIYTSNKSLDELHEFFYDEDPEGKIVDRIRDMAGVFAFKGESKRGRR